MEVLELHYPSEEEKKTATESDYQKLFGFGAKIAVLLDKPEISSDPNSVGLLDDLLGAVYSLIFARHYTFDNRTNKPVEINVIQIRASQIKNGEVRCDGKWIAGWHFNSSLFRISAVYHRLLKLITGKSGYKGTLLCSVKSSYKH